MLPEVPRDRTMNKGSESKEGQVQPTGTCLIHNYKNVMGETDVHISTFSAHEQEINPVTSVG
jgi:hypothetical protein